MVYSCGFFSLHLVLCVLLGGMGGLMVAMVFAADIEKFLDYISGETGR